jgi:hypothetical protein
VTDTVTGLIWLKNANCISTMSFAAANQAAAGLATGQCGLTDGSSAGEWRLATPTEWSLTTAHAGPPIIGLGCPPPTLTNDPGNGCLSAGPTSFTGVQSGTYWSSQAADGAPLLAFGMSLVNASQTGVSKVTGYFVWPVRGGK